jgi:ATP-dependent DNA helicase Rep
MRLNPQQQAAVEYFQGPLLVLAGAGSGKTRVITQKIVHLLKQLETPAKQICALTFTNKAAQEMNHRIGMATNNQLKKGLFIGTFHQLGLQFIKREYRNFGLPKRFSLFDAEDARQILKKILPKAKAQDKEFIQLISQQISLWKNALRLPEEIEAATPEDWEMREYYQAYQGMLQACQALDFDDLILRPALLLKQNETLRQQWMHQWRFILVDEYQDTNPAQYELIKCFLGPYTQLTVVGDDDQSIYAWRGANPENLNLLGQDFPSLKVIKLEQNYRSSSNILQAANALIDNNPHVFPKSLWSEHGPGDLLKVIQASDELQESELVVMDLLSHKYQGSLNWGQYAILYRGNHQSRHLEKILRKHHVPYQISGGQSWFGRSEIKDILAYLKLLTNFNDDAAFLRVINTPKRGIGEQSLKALSEYAKASGRSLLQCSDHMAMIEKLADKPRQELEKFKHWIAQWSEAFEQEQWPQHLLNFFSSSHLETYWYEESDNPIQAQKKVVRVQELLAWIQNLQQKNQEASLGDILHKLALIDLLSEQGEADEGAVQLMTLHAAKGLEFPHVYLIGMEEGLLPHQHSLDEANLNEERRLAYVGITRAQKSLVFSYAQKRKKGGEWSVSTPSRFLEELPQQLMIWQGKEKSDPAQAKLVAQSHLAGLKSLLT